MIIYSSLSFVHLIILIISVGLVISSALVLYSCLWLLYVFHLALKLFYPLKSAKLSNSVHRRAIVIAEILTMFLVSTLPSVVVAGVSDYKIRTFPPLFCGSDRSYRFYTTAIPILTSVCISLILMLLVIYRIHMVSTLISLLAECLLSYIAHKAYMWGGIFHVWLTD